MLLKHVKIQSLNDFFIKLEGRREKGTYFYRINGTNEEIHRFIRKYYDAARVNGVILEGRIANPSEGNLSYYEEIMGREFRMEPGFVTAALAKWLPRMNEGQRNVVASSLYYCLETLRGAGKNENMLKNAYIKFMCWLYYKFERIVNRLGDNDLPKILYEAKVGYYDLLLLSILSNAGCDVVLVQKEGDEAYLKADPGSALSDLLVTEGMEPFPRDFSLGALQKEIREEAGLRRLYGEVPSLNNCTNAWIKGKNPLEDLRTPIALRGKDAGFFYNCFFRLKGAEDKLTYVNSLYQTYLEIKNGKRNVVVVDKELPVPDMDEIGSVRRNGARQDRDQLLTELAGNLKSAGGPELQKLARRAFLDVMLAEAGEGETNLNRLYNKGVYLICWLKRYLPMLFSGGGTADVACFIHFGPCRKDNEALFLRLLARLPVDVLILCPNLNESCVLEDPLLYEKAYSHSLALDSFPRAAANLRAGTSAYHAERELDTLMYRDTGMYRDRQYGRANALTLRTMYEEIKILWDQEARFRPNFSVEGEIVTLPVIFSKVSGIKNGDTAGYWNSIRSLVRADGVTLITSVPRIDPLARNPMKAHATEFIKNGRLLRRAIREHKAYPYGFLRAEVQEHILDKLQLLLDQRLIRGTFENGTEYTIIATVLNLSKDMKRTLQKFDFTKKNPKVIYIITGESMLSLEDSIMTAFLNLAGFDILFFVPTGYQNVEKYFNTIPFEEHQIGDYVYDLQVPDLKSNQSGNGGSWLDIIFKRG